MCDFISGSSILFHLSTCLSLYQYHAGFNTIALYHYLRSRILIPPRSSFIVENSFPYPGIFLILNEFENCSFCEELSWNFDWDCIESMHCFHKMAIFTILILTIHEHWRYFHLLKYFLISFFSDLMFWP